MSTTVAAGFTELLGRLTPTTTESEAAKSHRASIKTCLESNFGTLKAFYRAGSFGNGTSIRGYSDVDYIAALPEGAIPENSLTLLERTRSALQRRFPQSGVFIHSPAVAVPFGTIRDETTEVTPARFEGVNASGHRIFGIAEGSGGWLRASAPSQEF